MKCKALVLTVQISLALFACAQPAPPSPPAPMAVTTARAAVAVTIPTCADSKTFLGKVAVLKLPYWPDPNAGTYQPPSPNGGITNTKILQDLAGAFCAANPRIKTDLLSPSLKTVYVNPCIEAIPSNCGNPNPAACDPNNCMVPISLDPRSVIANSWGFRDHSKNKYIATSAALWRNGGNAPIFTDYETMRLGAIVNQITGKNVPDLGKYVATDVNVNNSATTVLAVMAHEFAHAYWFDAFVLNPGEPADFTRFCNGRFYLGAGGNGTWAMPISFPGGKRWIDFAEIRNSHQSDDINISTLVSNLKSGNFLVAGDDLHTAFSGDLPNGGHNHQGGPWASPLAALSPDEDFVETYQLYALTQATPKLTTLQVNIWGKQKPIYVDDIPAYLGSKSELKRKMRCFGSVP